MDTKNVNSGEKVGFKRQLVKAAPLRLWEGCVTTN